MSLKILKKIFVACFLAVACTSLNARATLLFLDEWAKSLDHSNEKAKYVDLTWGAVAIETGFIHNLRFFGDYQIEVEKGKRIYAKDKSKDPLFAIIRELFPSTGGVLSINGGGEVPKLCNELSCIATALIIKNYFLEVSAQSKADIKNNISSYITSNTLKKENSDLDTLLDNIENIINAPDNHTKEVLAQVLLAFLYEKINLQGTEINDNTRIYKEETVGKLKSAFGEKMFLATIPQIEEETEYNKASKAARKYFNDLWQDNPFPYIAAPIQNGLAQVISMEGDPLSKTFPDCVEVAIRHFFNVMLYKDRQIGTFNCQNLGIANGKSDFFKDFYNQQSNRNLANNSSIGLRTMWNKVMSNIPEVIYRTKDDGTRIDKIEDMKPYQPNAGLPGNEIKAGIINLYNVLAYLLGESQIPTGEKDVADFEGTMTRYGLIKQFYDPKGNSKCELSEMLQTKFNKLLTQFACTATIDFHSLDKNNNASVNEPDLYGNVIIEKFGKPLITLKMQNGHGLLTLTKINNINFRQSDLVQKNPTLILLSNRKFESYEKDHPYYYSFHGPEMLEPGETEVDKICEFLKKADTNALLGVSIKEYYNVLLFENM